jgi:hypothetical protein
VPRRHIPIFLVLSAVLSGVLYWRWLSSNDEVALRRIVRVAISGSGRWIAAGGASGWIGIIDQTSPDAPQRFRGGPGKLQDLRFSKDEQWLIVVNDSAARHPVRSLGSLEAVKPGDDSGEPQSTPDALVNDERTSNLASGPGGIAVFGSEGGVIEVRDLHTGKMLRRFTFR